MTKSANESHRSGPMNTPEHMETKAQIFDAMEVLRPIVKPTKSGWYVDGAFGDTFFAAAVQWLELKAKEGERIVDPDFEPPWS